MNQTFDVVVLGGGVIGCSTAYHLAKKGAKVMVIDRRVLGGDAAALSAGLLAAQSEAESPGPVLDAALASRNLFQPLAEEVAEQSGIDPELEWCGIWRVAASEEEEARLVQLKEWQRGLGLAVEWQDAGRIKEAHPGLGENRGGVWFPGDGLVNSGLWVSALAESCRRKGVRFLDQAPAVEFVRERRRLVGVRSAEDEFSGDKIVLASGAWTSLLLETLRVALPLEPVRGQLMVLAGVPRALRGPVFASAGFMFPRSDGRLVVGTTYEKAGFEARPTLDAQRFLADWAARWCPGLRDLPVVDFQAGLRPGTQDGAPVMGRLWDYDNLFIAAGHFKWGILLSPWTGRYMADGILDDRWDPLGAAFSPSRFREKPS